LVFVWWELVVVFRLIFFWCRGVSGRFLSYIDHARERILLIILEKGVHGRTASLLYRRENKRHLIIIAA